MPTRRARGYRVCDNPHTGGHSGLENAAPEPAQSSVVCHRRAELRRHRLRTQLAGWRGRARRGTSPHQRGSGPPANARAAEPTTSGGPLPAEQGSKRARRNASWPARTRFRPAPRRGEPSALLARLARAARGNGHALTSGGDTPTASEPHCRTPDGRRAETTPQPSRVQRILVVGPKGRAAARTWSRRRSGSSTCDARSDPRRTSTEASRVACCPAPTSRARSDPAAVTSLWSRPQGASDLARLARE
jgi:hypothetical protein